jgi:hypothetical protein
MVAGSQPAMPQETIRANGWISRRLASANMPGKVDRIRAGLLRIAKHNVVDLLWTDAGSLNGGATGDDAEFGSVRSLSTPQNLPKGVRAAERITISLF